MELENMIDHLPNDLTKFHFCKKKGRFSLMSSKYDVVSEKVVFAILNYYIFCYFLYSGAFLNFTRRAVGKTRLLLMIIRCT